MQQVADALARQTAEQVLVARRASPALGLLCLIGILDAQVRVAA